MAAWTEAEVKGAVQAYFDLLALESKQGSSNKSEVYRKLARRFPVRSPKAFERKFQNISAILYEQNLPYCSGLKPFGNYQRLLKLMVLDHLDKTPVPSVEPHEIIFVSVWSRV